MQVQKKKKWEKKNNVKCEKGHTSINGSKVYLYQEKWLYFRSEHSDTRSILNFRAKDLNIFGSWKRSENFSYMFCSLGKRNDERTSQQKHCLIQLGSLHKLTNGQQFPLVCTLIDHDMTSNVQKSSGTTNHRRVASLQSFEHFDVISMTD